MAELRQSGTIDPAAEEQLADDLQQSDPAIWPLVIQQCRATQAYRRQAMRRSGLESARSVKGDSPPATAADRRRGVAARRTAAGCVSKHVGPRRE